MCGNFHSVSHFYKINLHQLRCDLWDVTICGFLYLEQGWRTFGTRAQNGTRKNFLGTRHSLLSQIFISSVRPAFLYCEEHVHIHTYMSVYRLYNNYRCYQITLQVKHFYTNMSGAKCSLAFIIGAAAWRWLGEHVTLDRTFYSLLFSHEVVAAQLLPHFLAYHTPQSGLYQT